MLSGINSSAVLTIFKQQLKLQKVCATWISHLLTGEQKQNIVDCAKQSLENTKIVINGG